MNALNESPNTVVSNLLKASIKIVLKGQVLKGQAFNDKDLINFIDHVDSILKKVRTEKFTPEEHIIYSKLVYMLYFAVNKVNYFRQVPELHGPYEDVLKLLQVILEKSSKEDFEEVLKALQVILEKSSKERK